MTESTGDPACWLDRVCEVCGAFVEAGDEDTHVCRAPVPSPPLDGEPPRQ